MKRLKVYGVFMVLAAFVMLSATIQQTSTAEVTSVNNTQNQCISCHKGIEDIRDPSSGMMVEILTVAQQAGFPGNDCIVCHGGNPTAASKELAHTGSINYFEQHPGPKNFYPDPGSPWINENTCGTCHPEQVSAQYTSLMFTEAGKIQGSLWGFGGQNGYQHNIGNYETEGVDPHDALGTDSYKKYISELRELEPNMYPDKMMAIPKAPTAEEVDKNPELSVYTYLRQECQRCHTGTKGRQKRGDYRGMGCTSCHVPYSNEGFYEGGDLSIDRNEPGHLLVHSLQATRDCKVTVHENEYSGIPVETCTTCHDRGKRIGTSFQGLMETAYSSPFMGDGEKQPKLHSKNYLHLHADIHKDKGMLCQDCHTSGDVHSDGTLSGSTLAPVEIECQDCHGTPQKYPWELPLGYSDEISGNVPKMGEARGVTKELLEYLKKGTVYEPKDGYLISTRGNPIPNLVKDENRVIVHTAGGKDIELEPLKKKLEEKTLSIEAQIAMVNVQGHIDKMECYTCHSTWAPQCYGCHIEIDYSKEMKHPDWVAMGNDHDESGLTADARGEYNKHLIDGVVTEQRSFLRWENPPLVVNGENRISPGVPGCQTSLTVIGKDGNSLLTNHIFKIPNVEGRGDDGQLGIDISPIQPHTTTKEARTCESCHTNPQAMGYGIEGGSIYKDPSKEYVVDITDAEGNVLSKRSQTQINSIPNLTMDWSRFVDEEGNQLQTVGHHFSSSRPLNNEERSMLDRRGVCASCHQVIPDKDLAVNLMTHMVEVTGLKVDNKEHQNILTKGVKLGAWVQVIGALSIIAGLIFGIRWWTKR